MRLEDIRYDVFYRVKQYFPSAKVNIIRDEADNEINAIEIHTEYKTMSFNEIKLFIEKYQEISKGKIKGFIEAKDDRIVLILTYS